MNLIPFFQSIKLNRVLSVSLVASLFLSATSCSNKTSGTKPDEVTQKTAAVESPSDSPTPTTSPDTSTPTPSTSGVVSEKLKPGEFVKPAFDGKVNIEIVRVNRVQNRKTGAKDLVNVQFRVRKISEGLATTEIIKAYEIVGRNQEDSSKYDVKPNDGHYTQTSITPQGLKKDVSVDAYAWLSDVPEGLNSIEVKIPGADPFPNVPIEDWREEVAKASTKVQPGKLIQTAFENRAKVELLQVNRIKSGDNKGKVHIRFSVSRTGDKVFGNDEISLSEVIGSNINTNEVYSGSSNDRISLKDVTKGKPVEASVLLTVPDDVYSLIIRMPSTQAFNDVPIDNN